MNDSIVSVEFTSTENLASFAFGIGVARLDQFAYAMTSITPMNGEFQLLLANDGMSNVAEE